MFHSHQNDEAIKEVQANIQRQLDAMGKTSYDLLHDCKNRLLSCLLPRRLHDATSSYRFGASDA